MLHPVVIVLALLILNLPAVAQEVKAIDLTTISQRKQLRFPPEPHMRQGVGSVGAMGVGSDCGLDARDPRSLSVNLVSAVARSGDPKRPFEVVFKVLNTGSVSLQLPVYPHLSDLQPDDASKEFSYSALSLTVSPSGNRDEIGRVELYGKRDVPETVVSIRPNEWLLVKAAISLSRSANTSDAFGLVPGFELEEDTFHTSPNGSASSAQKVCIKFRPSEAVPVTQSER